jgi:hypothetical protein
VVEFNLKIEVSIFGIVSSLQEKRVLKNYNDKIDEAESIAVDIIQSQMSNMSTRWYQQPCSSTVPERCQCACALQAATITHHYAW